MIGGKYAEMFALGLRNMRGYKLRSFLSMLGIGIGVASVIAMFATAEGAEREILAQIGRLGVRNIIINSVKPAEQRQDSAGTSWVLRFGLTFRDHRQIAATVSTASQVLPVHTNSDVVWEGSRRVDGKLHGVQPQHMRLLKLDVTAGRSLTEMDNLLFARVCVVRPGLLRELGWFGEPLGHRLMVGEQYYEIVGLLAEEEFTGLTQKALNVDSRSFEIYAPYETVLKRHGTTSIIRKSGAMEATDVQLHQILVEVDEQDNVLATARMIQQILEKFHPERDYEMIVPLELLAQRQKAQQVFSYALLAIALVSLMVGGIGIMNIMLATITERTREIGIRRALGAKKRHIVAQFLTETVTMTAVGGCLGLMLGFLADWLLRTSTGWSTVVSGEAVILSMGISCLVGILAGLWPAGKAARMDPIAALRYE
ncbi:MAG: ABC transporter permease [Planctomycetes bacterium]|jgi:putative ABC transport system permease protein|nr:ABC transporter permease [Planctomycetota bacterium]